MPQGLLAILIVAACVLWLGLQVFRFFRPRAGQSGCAGGCCDHGSAKPAATSARGTLMISSDDLRARLAARKK